VQSDFRVVLFEVIFQPCATVKIITNSKRKMESELARISKLKNIENWGIWKFQVRVMLNANGSWGVASGKN
jgi:hypothetical protein